MTGSPAGGGEAPSSCGAASPVVPPLPLELLQQHAAPCPPSPASPESGVDVTSVCILSLDLTLDCGGNGEAVFTLDDDAQATPTSGEPPRGTAEAGSCSAHQDAAAGGRLTASTSSLLFDEKYYEKDDFEPYLQGGGEGRAVPPEDDDALVSALQLQGEGDIPQLADTTVAAKEEDDFIEIDCNVQPMEALKRPLVYGYGGGPGGRLLRDSALNEKRLSGASVVSDYLEMDLVEAVLKTASGKDALSGGSCLDLKETYWDHWTARREAAAGQKLLGGNPQGVGLAGCPSTKFCYDPEVLLAQVRCPKSLEDATFKQYSACVKSHIYEHFGAVQEGLKEYGLTHGRPDFMCSQPDLPGQPREAGTWPLDYSSEPELATPGTPRHTARPLPPPHFRDREISVDSGTWSYMPGSGDSTAVPSPRCCYPPEAFPRPSSSLSHVAVGGGYDPWLHLLPDVTPPRTPRHSK